MHVYIANAVHALSIVASTAAFTASESVER